MSPEEKKPDRKVRKIMIDRELCIGAANCLAIAPEAFALDEENKAVVREGWNKETDEFLKQAAAVCPTQAIFLYDENEEEIKTEADKQNDE